VAQRVLALASPKDRKHILKSFKGFVLKIAMEQYGHAVLLTIFEAVDDSVLVQKAIVSELCKDLPTLTHNVYGIRVLLFLLAGRNKRYQPAFIVAELEALDAIRARTCKKDDATKTAQLPALFLAEGGPACIEHVQELVRHKFGCQLLLEVAKAPGVGAEVLGAIAETARTYAPSADGGANATSSEEFNAIKKLSAEQAALDRLGKGIDLGQHPLVNRSATFLFKDILTAQAEAGVPAAGSPLHFATLLTAALLPGLPGWVEQMAARPAAMSGMVHVLMGCLQECPAPLQEGLRKALPVAKVQRALEALRAQEGRELTGVEAEAQALKAARAAKGDKRKRPAAAVTTAEEGGKAKPVPLEQLLAMLA
jgi:pumilio family protein 6